MRSNKSRILTPLPNHRNQPLLVILKGGGATQNVSRSPHFSIEIMSKHQIMLRVPRHLSGALSPVGETAPKCLHTQTSSSFIEHFQYHSGEHQY